jgi:hypothetical protein
MIAGSELKRNWAKNDNRAALNYQRGPQILVSRNSSAVSYSITVEFSKWAAAKLWRAESESNFEASTVTMAVFLAGSVSTSTTPGTGESVFFTSLAQSIHVIPGMLSDTNVVSALGIEIDRSDEDVLLTGPLPLGAGTHPAASTTSSAGNQRVFINCSYSCVGKSELRPLSVLSVEKPSRSISDLRPFTLPESDDR